MPTKPPIYAAYLRVSTALQQEAGTVQNQDGELTRYCTALDLHPTTRYVDEDVSGTYRLEDRAAGQQLMSDARAGKFTVLLVYKLDRLGRNTRMILNAVHDLEQLGVRVQSISEQFDSSTPAGRFLMQMLAGVGELERETILERSRIGTDRVAREGKWLGGIVPYGYRVGESGYLEIAEEVMPGCGISEADVVRQIFRRCGRDGWSTTAIAEELNTQGIPPSYTARPPSANARSTRGKRRQATAGVWRDGGISRLLANTTYRGEHQYGKRSSKEREVIVRAVPAIVTPEEWIAARETLQRNTLDALRNRRRDYLLRGLVHCGACGHHYVGSAYKRTGGEVVAYYMCGEKSRHRYPTDPPKCTNRNVPAGWLEETVWQECVGFLTNPGNVLAEIMAGGDVPTPAAVPAMDREAILADYARLEEEKGRVLLLFRRGLISSEDVEGQLAAIGEERKQIERRESSAAPAPQRDQPRQAEHYAAIEAGLTALGVLLNGELEIEERRSIVRALVREIVVLPDDEERKPGKPRPDVRVRVRFVFGSEYTGSNPQGHPCAELSRQYAVSVTMGTKPGATAWWQQRGLSGVPHPNR